MEYKNKRRRKKRILVSRELIEPLFKNAPLHDINNVLPDDAIFESAFMEESRGMLSLVFCSEEWERVAEGETIPEHNPDIENWECRNCGNQVFLDEGARMKYCPVCEHERRY